MHDQKRPDAGAGLLGRWLNVRGPRARLLNTLVILALLGVLLLGVDSLARTSGLRAAAPGGAPAAGGSSAVVWAETDADAAPAAGAAGAGTSVPGQDAAAPGSLAEHERRLAQELEAVLSSVAGAGRVRATVRLATGPSRVVALNTRQSSRQITERDHVGAVRETADGEEQSAPVLLRYGDTDRPLTVREEAPRIAGVVVVADGAVSDRVREQLYRTAAAALAVPLSRITVVPMGGSAP